MKHNIIHYANTIQEHPPMPKARFDVSSIKQSLCIVFLLLCMGGLCAQDRMTPTKIACTSDSRRYEDILLSYFDIGSADKIAYLVTSSFRPPYCLSYKREEHSLILKQPTPESWYKHYNSPKHLRADQWKLCISDSLADSLQAMFAAAVLTSSYLSEQAGIDGAVYRFFLHPGPYSRVASCWSPDKNSNCGQAVAVVKQLCDAVKKNDHEGAEALVKSISSVTNRFRSYYPAHFHESIYLLPL